MSRKINKLIEQEVAQQLPQDTKGLVEITSLFDFFHTGISYAPLAEGMHTVRLVGMENVTPRDVNKKPYVQWKLQILATGQIVNHNVFESGIPYLDSQLRTQLYDVFGDETVPMAVIIQHLMNNDFNLWIEKVSVDGRKYDNFHFSEIVSNATVSDRRSR